MTAHRARPQDTTVATRAGTCSRRQFLYLAAGAAAVAGTAAACAAGSANPAARSGAGRRAGRGTPTLRIAQWSHFVPAYDTWFDNQYTKQWGEDHGVQVVVDHINVTELQDRADAEVVARGGHDLFGFLTPPVRFEDEVADLADVVERVEAKLGTMLPVVERSVRNPRTGKYFGFPDFWVPSTIQYRVDLWESVDPGQAPGTWDDILRVAPKLKARGHPIGIGFSRDVDYSFTLLDLMQAYGASIQDEDANVTINSAATVEAVRMGVALFRSGMTDETLSWDAASDNRFLASGTGSLILDPLGTIRAIEQQNPDLAGKVALAPVPAGPAGRMGPVPLVGYMIWKFSPHEELAKQFLVDLALNNRETFVRSLYYSFPAFPAAVPDLAALVAHDDRAQPPGKYAILADAHEWMTNLGHPGTANVAVDEVFRQFVIPGMFAAAARGEMSAEDAVAAAEAEIKPIYDKWRERGKL